MSPVTMLLSRGVFTIVSITIHFLIAAEDRPGIDWVDYAWDVERDLYIRNPEKRIPTLLINIYLWEMQKIVVTKIKMRNHLQLTKMKKTMCHNPMRTMKWFPKNQSTTNSW